MLKSNNDFPSFIEINGDQFTRNVTILQEIAGSASVGVVLKANAYGHGITGIASLCTTLSSVISCIFVSTLLEAAEVRAAGWQGRIVIFSHRISEEFLSNAEALSVEITVYSPESASMVFSYCHRNSRQLPLQIKCNTGMNRFGFNHAALNEFFVQAKEHHSDIRGLYTHCYDSRRASIKNIIAQSALFNQMIATGRKFFPSFETHTASSGVLGGAPLYSMVRVGSLLYGLWKSKAQKKRCIQHYPQAEGLQQLMTWKTKVVQHRVVEKHEHIGYGHTVRFQKKKIIGVIPVGYSDGYSKILQQVKPVFVAIGKKKAAIIAINMNASLIDITNQFSQVLNEWVYLTHPQLMPLSVLAERSNSESIFISAAIKESIPRIVVNDHATLL